MIQCPACSAPLEISREQQIERLKSTTDKHTYALCYTLGVPVHCPKCKEVIPIDMLDADLLVEIPISEGAKLMASRATKRFDSQSGSARAASLKRWAQQRAKDES